MRGGMGKKILMPIQEGKMPNCSGKEVYRKFAEEVMMQAREPYRGDLCEANAPAAPIDPLGARIVELGATLFAIRETLGIHGDEQLGERPACESIVEQLDRHTDALRFLQDRAIEILRCAKELRERLA
jgi:hypothetical protein